MHPPLQVIMCLIEHVNHAKFFVAENNFRTYELCINSAYDHQTLVQICSCSDDDDPWCNVMLVNHLFISILTVVTHMLQHVIRLLFRAFLASKSSTSDDVIYTAIDFSAFIFSNSNQVVALIIYSAL